MNLVSIDSDNGLSPDRRHAIFLTNAGILLIGPLGTNVSEIRIKIHNFSFTKMHLKMSSGKWRPFCPGGDELNQNAVEVGVCMRSHIQEFLLDKITYPSHIPMMTSSNGNIRSPVNSPHKGQWRGALMFSLICALNKLLSTQSWGWWFETPSRSLWRHCNAMLMWLIYVDKRSPGHRQITRRHSRRIYNYNVVKSSVCQGLSDGEQIDYLNYQ